MNKRKIIDICEKYKDSFMSIIKDLCYENKGIFNSEMLLIVTLARYFNISEIWESGRARGQSTKVLAESFKHIDVNIHSVESLRDTEDDIVATKRLKDYHNLELLYGDSVDIIPQNIKNNKNTFVLIDGPKGTTAISLATTLLKNKNVKAVFMHDYHKDSSLREVVEEKFDNTFFTDDKTYVEKFKDLDDICWIKHAKISRTPYNRDGRKMQSYSSTLCVIFNK